MKNSIFLSRFFLPWKQSSEQRARIHHRTITELILSDKRQQEQQ